MDSSGEYFTQYLKVRVSHRGDFLIGVATSMAATIFALGFVLVLFSQSASPGRLAISRRCYFSTASRSFPSASINVLSVNLYEFGNEYIMEGKFDRVLIRPVSSLFQVLFENFRIESFQEVIVGSGGGLVGVAPNALSLEPWRMCCCWFSSRSAAATIYISVFLMLSCVSFWFEDRIGVHPPAWNLLAFGRYPLSIYSGFIQFFLSWIIPFGFATFYPSVRLLHRGGYLGYAPLVPVVTAVFLGLAMLLWNFGVRHYSSTGS